MTTDAPCTCPLVDDPEIGAHTELEHHQDSCGGISAPAPCGGCYDCLLAQAAHARRTAARARQQLVLDVAEVLADGGPILDEMPAANEVLALLDRRGNLDLARQSPTTGHFDAATNPA